MGTSEDNFNVKDAIRAFELDKKECADDVIVIASSERYAKLVGLVLRKVAPF